MTAMLLWLGVLVRAGDSYGAWTVVTYYVVPIVVFASWLVVRCAATRHCSVLSLVVVVRDPDWCSVPSLLVSAADEYNFVCHPRHRACAASQVTTFLHHNEPGVPWYGNDEWTFVKGALSSVDRDYWPFNTIVHDIGTHQASCHSQFSPACAPSSPLPSHKRVHTRHSLWGRCALGLLTFAAYVCVRVCVPATAPLHCPVRCTTCSRTSRTTI